MKEIPPLPVRVPRNRSITATLRLWYAPDRSLLERVRAGLRALPDHPTPYCRSREEIRGYAHAHQVMAAHAAHRCPRYEAAAEYALRARP